ncbi:MAG TPA: AsmA family protein, partial [Anseongella sp.]|nr:AsmA family protein [Anseongella sp.]
MKKGIRIAFKIVLWLLLGIFVLAVAAAALVQLPAVQDFAREKAVNYLREKLQTEVKIDYVRLRLPNTLLMENIYLEDRQQDTLLSSGRFFVDISLFKLLKNEVEINEIRVEKFRANISRSLPDSSYNFDFIIDAFAVPGTPPEPEDTSAAPLVLSLREVVLDDIRLDYLDETLESGARLYLGHFMARMNGTDIENMRFRVEKTETSGTRLEYYDRKGGLETRLQLGGLSVSALGLDLLKQQLDLGQITLDNSRAAVAFRKTGAAPRPAETTADSLPESPESAAGWNVTVSELLVNNTALRFDDDNSAPQPAGMDYMHLDVTGL